MSFGSIFDKGTSIGVMTAAVAVGLFAAKLAGDFVPDNLAASVCMFAAGVLGGYVLGIRHAMRTFRPVSTPRTPVTESTRRS